jgi:hypothetical protein
MDVLPGRDAMVMLRLNEERSFRNARAPVTQE